LDEEGAHLFGRNRSKYVLFTAPMNLLHNNFSRNLREGDHLQDPGVNGRIILKWIFERLGGGRRLD
jgi:hypothetical protein